MNTEAMFSDEEGELLKRIAREIIPPAPDAGLPGGDDEQVLERLSGNATGKVNGLRGELNRLADEEGGVAALGARDQARFDAWFSHWAEGWPERTHPFFKLFVPMLLRAYYQDSRVHVAYGRRPGPPFPEGYELTEGDWSLLDKVRGRPPFYRR